MTDTVSRARDWIEADPDPITKAELTRIIESGDHAELEDRMNGTLTFGTAGIRGVVEAGSNRLNRAAIIRTTAGLAAYLLANTADEDRVVVIGRDARPSSPVFMKDTVGVLVAAGFEVRYFQDPTPTPLVAYAGLTLGACASIVITASHNPPRDNGYKVYAANGAQIVPPVDTDIAALIDEAGPAVRVPRITEPFAHHGARAIDAEMFDGYLRAVASALPSVTGDRSISIVYTAMHGVGGKFVTEALRRFGFSSVHPVAKQFAPDGLFPTVPFPNPEEPGALDMAHELAAAIDADLVIANDPDTDRLAVSVPDPGGIWRPLTGNQIGSLLAEFLLSHRDGPGTTVNSVVSSPLLATIAERHGVESARTLTGFKWIWNAALELQAEGRGDLVLGYEEALGYSVGTTVRDKDGISAAVAFAIMAAEAAADGKTVLDLVGELYSEYGVCVSAQVSIRMDGPQGSDQIEAAMAALRADPPTEVAGRPVVETLDFLTGAKDRPSYLAESNLIELDFGVAGRMLARPSGTEPKLKIYVDLIEPFPASGDWMGAEALLAAAATEAGNELAAWMRTQIGA
jgi:phosphomannomutase